jgi:Holliday junction resolvase-like predicted endonuclease
MNRYAKGARLERLAAADLREDGYTVTRSAGSKGPVDLIAYSERRVRFIQVKARGQVHPDDRAALRRLRVPSCASREIWERNRIGGWIVRRIGRRPRQPGGRP